MRRFTSDLGPALSFYGPSRSLVMVSKTLNCNVLDFSLIDHPAVFGQYMWIEHRDVEGGPPAYVAEHISDWYNTWGTAAGIMMNFMSDGLLVCMIASGW
jgi:hypothetical protein